MPPLGRNAPPLLGTVGGKATAGHLSPASATPPSPSPLPSLPQSSSRPPLERRAKTAAAAAVATKGDKGGRQLRPRKVEADLVSEIKDPQPKKQRKATSITTERGVGPAQRPASTAAVPADQKGTSLCSDVSLDSTPPSRSLRGAPSGKRTLKTLEPIAPPGQAQVPRTRRQIRLLREMDEEPCRAGDAPEKENIRCRGGVQQSVSPSSQASSTSKIKILPPIQLSSSLDDGPSRGYPHESTDGETGSVTSCSQESALSKGKPRARNRKGSDTALTPRKEKRKTLKLLPPVDNTSKPITNVQSTRIDCMADFELDDSAVADEHDLSDSFSSDHSQYQDGILSTTTVCPICQEPVDRMLLEEWQGRRQFMRIGRQMAFCDAHKRATANDEYVESDYPVLDADALAAMAGRIERFRNDLVAIVHCRQSSTFRDTVKQEADKGEGRTLLQTKSLQKCLAGMMSVGYYGPRGRRAMEDWLAHQLADEIQSAAGCDRLIAYKTVSGFIQEVLVPEVAMRLVAEDLHVSNDKAREVLRESANLGELVNRLEEEEGEPVLEGGAAVQEEDGDDY